MGNMDTGKGFSKAEDERYAAGEAYTSGGKGAKRGESVLRKRFHATDADLSDMKRNAKEDAIPDR
jgi:hypothetical protein